MIGRRHKNEGEAENYTKTNAQNSEDRFKSDLGTAYPRWHQSFNITIFLNRHIVVDKTTVRIDTEKITNHNSHSTVRGPEARPELMSQAGLKHNRLTEHSLLALHNRRMRRTRAEAT